ncbi:MAG: hypothetical protein JNM59_08895 [Hyphomonadaceae bacterium]|nr:hypothetical protein [Hyphomonadaceae bacterium]
MRWTERVLSLAPWAVSSTFIATVAVAAALVEFAFPLGSALFPFGIAISWLVCGAPMLTWPYALFDVAAGKTFTPSQHRHGRRYFVATAVLGLAWCGLASFITSGALPYSMVAQFGALALLSLVVGVNLLRAVGVTVHALHASEGTEATIGTFMQIFYFPLGIWFLRSRVERLIFQP